MSMSVAIVAAIALFAYVVALIAAFHISLKYNKTRLLEAVLLCGVVLFCLGVFAWIIVLMLD